jgi:hypothetical protein
MLHYGGFAGKVWLEACDDTAGLIKSSGKGMEGVADATGSLASPSPGECKYGC